MNPRLAIFTLILVSCAGSDMLRKATASETGIPAKNIAISERVRLVDEVKWKARSGDVRYACESICANKKCDELDEASTVCKDLTFEELE